MAALLIREEALLSQRRSEKNKKDQALMSPSSTPRLMGTKSGDKAPMSPSSTPRLMATKSGDKAPMSPSSTPRLMATKSGGEASQGAKIHAVIPSKPLTLEARFWECLEVLCPEIFGWKTVGADNIKNQSICTGLKDAFSDSELRDWVQLVMARLDEKEAPIEDHVPLPTLDLSEFPPLPAMPVGMPQKTVDEPSAKSHADSSMMVTSEFMGSERDVKTRVLDQIKNNMSGYEKNNGPIIYMQLIVQNHIWNWQQRKAMLNSWTFITNGFSPP